MKLIHQTYEFIDHAINPEMITRYEYDEESQTLGVRVVGEPDNLYFSGEAAVSLKAQIDAQADFS